LSPNLFPDFLENSESYEAAETYWKDLVEQTMADVGESPADWVAYIPRNYADGRTPIRTPGNPIIDRCNRKLDRAFQIVQHPPAGPEIDFAAWINTYEDEKAVGADVPGSELVLSLSLSDESATLARELLKKWLTPSSSRADVEELILTTKAQGGSSP
jgi:hypothetical protein